MCTHAIYVRSVLTLLSQAVDSSSARSSLMKTWEVQLVGCSRPLAWARGNRGAPQNTADYWRATASYQRMLIIQTTCWMLCSALKPDGDQQHNMESLNCLRFANCFQDQVLWPWPVSRGFSSVGTNDVFDVSPPGSAVLIAETMLDGWKPHAALQSLNMLVQTEGMERRERQFADLLCQHGFGDVQVVHTRNFLDALIAFKM